LRDVMHPRGLDDLVGALIFDYQRPGAANVDL
jgi:hypothetical protein